MSNTAEVIINSPDVWFGKDDEISRKTQQISALDKINARNKLNNLTKNDFYSFQQLLLLLSKGFLVTEKITDIQQVKGILNFYEGKASELSNGLSDYLFNYFNLNDDELINIFNQYPNAVQKLSQNKLQKYAESSPVLARYILSSTTLRKILDENKYARYKIYKKHQDSLFVADKAANVRDIARIHAHDQAAQDRRRLPAEWQQLDQIYKDVNRLETEKRNFEIRLENLNTYSKAVETVRPLRRNPQDPDLTAQEEYVKSLKTKLNFQDESQQGINQEIKKIKKSISLKRGELDQKIIQLRQLCDKTQVDKRALDIFLRRQAGQQEIDQSRQNLFDLINMSPRYMTLLDERHIEAMFALVQDQQEFLKVMNYLLSQKKTTDELKKLLVDVANVIPGDHVKNASIRANAILNIREHAYNAQNHHHDYGFLSRSPETAKVLYETHPQDFAGILACSRYDLNQFDILEQNRNWVNWEHIVKINEIDGLDRKKFADYMRGKRDDRGLRPLDKLRSGLKKALSENDKKAANNPLILSVMTKNDIRGWIDLARKEEGKNPKNYVKEWLDYSKQPNQAYHPDVCQIIAQDKNLFLKVRDGNDSFVKLNDTHYYLWATKFVWDTIKAQGRWFRSGKIDDTVQFFIDYFLDKKPTSNNPFNPIPGAGVEKQKRENAICWYFANNEELFKCLSKKYIPKEGWFESKEERQDRMTKELRINNLKQGVYNTLAQVQPQMQHGNIQVNVQPGQNSQQAVVNQLQYQQFQQPRKQPQTPQRPNYNSMDIPQLVSAATTQQNQVQIKPVLISRINSPATALELAEQQDPNKKEFIGNIFKENNIPANHLINAVTKENFVQIGDYVDLACKGKVERNQDREKLTVDQVVNLLTSNTAIKPEGKNIIESTFLDLTPKDDDDFIVFLLENTHINAEVIKNNSSYFKGLLSLEKLNTLAVKQQSENPDLQFWKNYVVLSVLLNINTNALAVPKKTLNNSGEKGNLLKEIERQRALKIVVKTETDVRIDQIKEEMLRYRNNPEGEEYQKLEQELDQLRQSSVTPKQPTRPGNKSAGKAVDKTSDEQENKQFLAALVQKDVTFLSPTLIFLLEALKDTSIDEAIASRLLQDEALVSAMLPEIAKLPKARLFLIKFKVAILKYLNNPDLETEKVKDIKIMLMFLRLSGDSKSDDIALKTAFIEVCKNNPSLFVFLVKDRIEECALVLLSDVKDQEVLNDNTLYLSVETQDKDKILCYKIKDLNGKIHEGKITKTSMSSMSTFQRLVTVVERNRLGDVTQEDKNSLVNMLSKKGQIYSINDLMNDSSTYFVDLLKEQEEFCIREFSADEFYKFVSAHKNLIEVTLKNPKYLAKLLESTYCDAVFLSEIAKALHINLKNTAKPKAEVVVEISPSEVTRKPGRLKTAGANGDIKDVLGANKSPEDTEEKEGVAVANQDLLNPAYIKALTAQSWQKLLIIDNGDLTKDILDNFKVILTLLESPDFTAQQVVTFEAYINKYLNNVKNKADIEGLDVSVYEKLLSANKPVIKNKLFSNSTVALRLLEAKQGDSQFILKYRDNFKALLNKKDFVERLTSETLSALLKAYPEGLPNEFAGMYAHHKELVKNIPNKDLATHWMLYQPWYEESAKAGQLTADEVKGVLSVSAAKDAPAKGWLAGFYAKNQANPAIVRALFSDAKIPEIKGCYQFYLPLINPEITIEALNKFIEADVIEIDQKIAAPEIFSKIEEGLLLVLEGRKTRVTENIAWDRITLLKPVLEKPENSKYLLKCLRNNNAKLIGENADLFIKIFDFRNIGLNQADLLKLLDTDNVEITKKIFESPELFGILSSNMIYSDKQLNIMLDIILDSKGGHLLAQPQEVLRVPEQKILTPTRRGNAISGLAAQFEQNSQNPQVSPLRTNSRSTAEVKSQTPSKLILFLNDQITRLLANFVENKVKLISLFKNANDLFKGVIESPELEAFAKIPDKEVCSLVVNNFVQLPVYGTVFGKVLAKQNSTKEVFANNFFVIAMLNKPVVYDLLLDNLKLIDMYNRNNPELIKKLYELRNTEGFKLESLKPDELKEVYLKNKLMMTGNIFLNDVLRNNLLSVLAEDEKIAFVYDVLKSADQTVIDKFKTIKDTLPALKFNQIIDLLDNPHFANWAFDDANRGTLRLDKSYVLYLKARKPEIFQALPLQANQFVLRVFASQNEVVIEEILPPLTPPRHTALPTSSKVATKRIGFITSLFDPKTPKDALERLKIEENKVGAKLLYKHCQSSPDQFIQFFNKEGEPQTLCHAIKSLEQSDRTLIINYVLKINGYIRQFLENPQLVSFFNAQQIVDWAKQDESNRDFCLQKPHVVDMLGVDRIFEILAPLTSQSAMDCLTMPHVVNILDTDNILILGQAAPENALFCLKSLHIINKLDADRIVVLGQTAPENALYCLKALHIIKMLDPDRIVVLGLTATQNAMYCLTTPHIVKTLDADRIAALGQLSPQNAMYCLITPDIVRALKPENIIQLGIVAGLGEDKDQVISKLLEVKFDPSVDKDIYFKKFPDHVGRDHQSAKVLVTGNMGILGRPHAPPQKPGQQSNNPSRPLGRGGPHSRIPDPPNLGGRGGQPSTQIDSKLTQGKGLNF